MKVNRFICYTATHNESGLVYVGVSSRTLEQRKQDHKHGAKGRRGRFPEAIREFGVDAFSWNVVAEGAKGVMRLIEQFLIYEWDTANPEFGYNETGGTHLAQIRYQLKKEHWKHFGPPWNKPVPEAERHQQDYLLTREMIGETDARIGWIERYFDSHHGQDIEFDLMIMVMEWRERLNAVCDKLTV